MASLIPGERLIRTISEGRIQPADDDAVANYFQPNGNRGRVLFLDSDHDAGATHEVGRVGTLRAYGSVNQFRSETGRIGTHQRVALLNPPVEYEQRVVVVASSDYYYLSGLEAIVVQSPTGRPPRPVVRFEQSELDKIQGRLGFSRYTEDSRFYISNWVLAANSPAPQAQEEIPEIPEYWERRVRDIAKKYADRNSWCDAVNQALREIFSVKPSTYVLFSTDEQGVAPAGYHGITTRLNPDYDNPMALFNDISRAQPYLAKINKADV